MRTLKQVYNQHPEKKRIKERLMQVLEISESTFYRLVYDGSIIGKTSVIALLINEFAIRLESETGFSIDYLKLTEIQNNTEKKTAEQHGLTT